MPWIFFSKIGGNEIPPKTMQYLFNWGGLPVGIVFLAFRSSANTSVVTVISSLYPLVTVLLAVIFLHERLTRGQLAGLFFAVAAFVIFSI